MFSFSVTFTETNNDRSTIKGRATEEESYPGGMQDKTSQQEDKSNPTPTLLTPLQEWDDVVTTTTLCSMKIITDFCIVL